MSDMIGKEAAALAVANVEIGYHDGISGDWHPLSGPAIISAACAAIRALPPAPDAEADKLRRTIAARDRRIERLVAALDDARAKGYVTQSEREPPVVLSVPDAVEALVKAAEAWKNERNALSAFEAANPGDSTKRWTRLLSSTEAAEEAFWAALAAIRAGGKP
jgi:hypothetical protein